MTGMTNGGYLILAVVQAKGLRAKLQMVGFHGFSLPISWWLWLLLVVGSNSGLFADWKYEAVDEDEHRCSLFWICLIGRPAWLYMNLLRYKGMEHYWGVRFTHGTWWFVCTIRPVLPMFLLWPAIGGQMVMVANTWSSHLATQLC